MSDRYSIQNAADEFVQGRVSGLDLDGNEYSAAKRLLKSAARDVVELAAKNNIKAPETDQPLYDTELGNILDKAVRPIEDLYWSFYRLKDEDKASVLAHRRSLLDDLKSGYFPEISRPDLESITGWYIANGVKIPTVDRLLVDQLIALEFSQYAMTVLQTPYGYVGRPILKRNVLLEWAVLNGINALFFGVVFCGFWVLQKVGIFPLDWLFVTALILIGLVILGAAWGLIMLPRLWLAVRKAKKQALLLLDNMNGAYQSLSSDGPISVSHVKSLVDRATEVGVVWPAPLHVLLEDIQERSRHF